MKVWRKCHEMTLAVCKVTRGFPDIEKFGLVKQMRNAAVSISSNVAEGSCRGTDLDFRRFLRMAMGSLAELEHQVLLSKDLSLLPVPEFQRLTVRIMEIRRMAWPLVERLSEAIGKARSAVKL